MSGVHTNMTNTRDTPVEAFERAYPMRVRRYTRSAPEAAATDAFRGGDGIERELEALEPVTVSLITERRVSAMGTRGRFAGRGRGELAAPRGDEGRAEPLGDKVTIQLHAGDVLRLRTPGGGGWGAP